MRRNEFGFPLEADLQTMSGDGLCGAAVATYIGLLAKHVAEINQRCEPHSGAIPINSGRRFEIPA